MKSLFILLLIFSIAYFLNKKFKIFKNYKYEKFLIEESIKISEKKLIKDRKLKGFINVSGNKRNFFNDYIKNNDLKEWLLENTKNIDIIKEVGIGKENHIEKAYFTHEGNIYAYKIDSVSKSQEKCLYIQVQNSYNNFKNFLTQEEYNEFNNSFNLEKTVYLNFTFKNNGSKFQKMIHSAINLNYPIKVNDKRIINFIKLLGINNHDKLVDFLETQKDKYITWLSIGKNREFSIYYMNKKYFDIFKNL